MFDRQNVVGTPLALVDYEKAMEVMDSMIEQRRPGYVIASAVHAAMVAREDPTLRAAMEHATMVVPDGMPLVWAAKRMGANLKDRVYGPELMARYCQRAAEKGYRVFLYGGHDQGSLLKLSELLRRRYPGLNVCGCYHPPDRELSEREKETTARTLNASRADMVWVGTGCPRQEKWMYGMRARLDAPVLVGVGAAFDFHSGRVQQAPPWMQRRGLEWLYRLSREPRRLTRRYLVYNARFIVAFARQYARHALRRS